MTKISPDSPQYREAVAAREAREAETGMNKNYNVFGAGLLRVLERSPDQEEAALALSMESFRKHLHGEGLTDEKKPAMQRALVSLVDSYLLKPGAKDEIVRVLNIESENLDHKYIVDAIENGTLPAGVYKKIIENHVERFNLRQERYEKKVWPEAKAVYQKKFFELNKKYNLGLTEEKISKKLAIVKVKLADDITSIRDGVFAGHNKYSDVITLAEGNLILGEPNAGHVVAHETTHALAGRNIRLRQFNETEEISITRGGFRFRDNIGSAKESDWFEWLNEAITESFSSEMGFLEDGLSPMYAKERELLAILCEKAKPPIEIGDFYRAYFEDFEPDQEGGPIPNFRDLMKKINTAYGNGFLGRLDKIVTEKGVEEAVRVMKEGKI